jgi:hypothetical protein
MSDDTKPIGYDSLDAALAAIERLEQAKLGARRSDREKLTLPISRESEPQRRPLVR